MEIKRFQSSSRSRVGVEREQVCLTGEGFALTLSSHSSSKRVNV